MAILQNGLQFGLDQQHFHIPGDIHIPVVSNKRFMCFSDMKISVLREHGNTFLRDRLDTCTC